MSTTIRSVRDLVFLILFDRLWIRLGILFLALSATLAGIAVPYFQRQFTTTLNQFPLFICTGLALASFFFQQLTNYFGQTESMVAQKTIADILYQHILKLKPLTTSHRSVGEMVSLYTTDIPSSTMWLEQSIPFALTTAFPLIIAPIFLNVIYSIPYSLILSMIGVIIFINILLARRQSVFFFLFKTLAGQRMGLVNEWIQNIKSLKSLNWVQSFENKIITKRIEETENRISMVTNGQMMNSISSSITFWLNLAVLTYITYSHTELISKIDLIAVFWVMGIFLAKPLRQLPWFFTMMFDAWTSVKRLGDFFSLENKLHELKYANFKTDTPSCLDVKNLNLQIEDQQLLKNINLTIANSEIVALIGPVGAGKSILIKSLMQETPFTADHLTIKPYNYLPQEPFILSATISENIIFDYKEKDFLDLNRQKKQIHSSPTIEQSKELQSLAKAQFDLNQDRINEGLETIIGERGLNISGGQKQRLNLARLFYNPQPLFLLDDPFSAVDVGTEKKLIQTLLDFKKSGHSFLIVTQRYDFLKYCDRIVFIDQGEIQFDGTYIDFVSQTRYQKFIAGDLAQNSLGEVHG